MADSSSDENNFEPDYVFYRDREEWKDIEPISQDDGPHPVVQIAYSDKFKDVYDYFRAILKRDERSERAFQLTADAADLNSANYTVWHYRRILLQDLKKDLREELKYISQMIEDHPKNYQVWHHRMCVVDWLDDSSRELRFTANILQQDAKNYHAWQHRQWVIKRFDLWNDEVAYTDDLLDEDLRNNSAWNQRHFVLSHTTNYDDSTVQAETQYCKKMIKKAPNNESAWNYLRGVLEGREISQYPGICDFCEELYNKDIRSPYLLGFMVEIDEEKLAKGTNDGGETLKHATKLTQDLQNNFDTIRVEYWKFVERSLQKYSS